MKQNFLSKKKSSRPIHCVGLPGLPNRVKLKLQNLAEKGKLGKCIISKKKSSFYIVGELSRWMVLDCALTCSTSLIKYRAYNELAALRFVCILLVLLASVYGVNVPVVRCKPGRTKGSVRTILVRGIKNEWGAN